MNIAAHGLHFQKPMKMSKMSWILCSDRRLMVRMFGKEYNHSHTSISSILNNDLGMGKISAKLFPKNLWQDQLGVRKYLSFLESTENDPNILDRVVTGDESWMYRYDPKTKRQCMEWHTSKPSKHKHRQVVEDQMHAHSHFWELVNCLRRVCALITLKRRSLKKGHACGNNHTAVSVNKFLTIKNFPVTPHPL